MYFIIQILNILFFILSLKFFSSIFKNKYIFPFRKSDLTNFITTTLLFLYINYFFYGINLKLILITIFVNLNLFYIFFHLLNMINTSPRTRILLDTYKESYIDIEKYKLRYNEKEIVKNRLERLMTTNQILIYENKVKLRKNFNFLSLVSFILNIIKKI
tara:strand:+ start:5845 stop:6321 length:477 start_codon:yes stop_codon:yes gene_type:complete